MLWDMARYQNYDIRSPYNREAAQWAANQSVFRFPTDARPLRDGRAALGRVEGDSSVARPAREGESITHPRHGDRPPTELEPVALVRRRWRGRSPGPAYCNFAAALWSGLRSRRGRSRCRDGREPAELGRHAAREFRSLHDLVAASVGLAIEARSDAAFAGDDPDSMSSWSRESPAERDCRARDRPRPR